MNTRRLQTFFKAHRRQNRRNAFGEHRLSCSRRANEKHVVTACHRNFDRTFRMELASNITEVFHPSVRFVYFQTLFPVHWIDGSGSVDELHNLRQCSYGVDSYSFNNCSFSSVSQWNQQVRNFAVARQHGDRQHALDRPEFSVERQLADHQVIRNILFGKKPESAEDSDGHRKIKGRAFLFYIRGSEVNDDLLIRSTVSIISDRRKHAVFRLPNRSIRQTDNYSLAIATRG